MLVNEANQGRDKARISSKDTNTSLNAWYDRFPFRNREALIDHGKSIAVYMNTYYSKLFNREDGDRYHLRQSSQGYK